MKKKISLLLCLIFTVLTLSACGGDPTTEDYYGVTYNDLKLGAEMTAGVLVSLSDEELQMEVASGQLDDLSMKMISGWLTSKEGIGAYQGLDELVVAKANGTVTVDQYINFEGRQLVLSFVYNYDYAEEELVITDVTVDIVYTLGEKMEKAALNTLMGMGTVFGVLILISLIISCFRFIGNLENLGKKKEVPAVEVAAPVVVEEAPLTDDLELVAVITAAIAASEGTSTDSFVVRSIHRR